MKTVKEIVKDYLEKHGYDGLYGEECGCPKDDLFECCGMGMESMPFTCRPGRQYSYEELEQIAPVDPLCESAADEIEAEPGDTIIGPPDLCERRKNN